MDRPVPPRRRLPHATRGRVVAALAIALGGFAFSIGCDLWLGTAGDELGFMAFLALLISIPVLMTGLLVLLHPFRMPAALFAAATSGGMIYLTYDAITDDGSSTAGLAILIPMLYGPFWVSIVFGADNVLRSRQARRRARASASAEDESLL